jgi:hypothetical protein
MAATNNENYQDVLARVLEQLAAANEPRFVRYEFGGKKSLFLIDPDKNRIFYNDNDGRALMLHERTALLTRFPEMTLIDIPREESQPTIGNLGLGGFHAKQRFPDNRIEDWLKRGKQALKERSGIEVKEESYTQAQQAFFATSKPAAHKAPVISKANQTVDPVSPEPPAKIERRR